MKLSDINEYIQTAAALGAILAIAAVGYEIRQSNRIAEQQNVSASYTNFVSFSMSEIESGISTAISKAVTEPETLSLAEKIDLNSWLNAFVGMYEHDYHTAKIGNAPESVYDYQIDTLSADSVHYFGNKYSRAWFVVNRSWISEVLAETIEESINSNPLGSSSDYFKKIDAHMDKVH